MKPVDQLILQTHPNRPPYGDCMRACIASLLEIPALAVPHFYDYPAALGGEPGFKELNAWLRPRGLSYLELCCDIKDYENATEMHCQGYHVIVGSAKGAMSYHAVVGYRGIQIHDPHPRRCGVVAMPTGDDREGFFLGFLTLLCGLPPGK